MSELVNALMQLLAELPAEEISEEMVAQLRTMVREESDG